MRSLEQKKEYRNRRRETIHGYVDRWMERVKYHTPDTDITREFLYSKTSDNKCEITGIEFDFSWKPEGCFHKPKAPSIDRIDSTKGYYTSNVQIILSWVNRAKNDTPDQVFKLLLKEALKGNIL